MTVRYWRFVPTVPDARVSANHIEMCSAVMSEIGVSGNAFMNRPILWVISYRVVARRFSCLLSARYDARASSNVGRVPPWGWCDSQKRTASAISGLLGA